MAGRYSAAERAQFGANRRARAAGLKYGYSYGDQGYTGAKESGQAAYALADHKKAFGAFASPTWDTKIENGVIMYRAKAKHTDRVKETGGKWFAAPTHVQNAYQKSRGFFAENPDATWQDFKMKQDLGRQVSTQGWTQDPNTGNWVNPMSAGDIRSATGRRIDPDTGQPLSDDRGLGGSSIHTGIGGVGGSVAQGPPGSRPLPGSPMDGGYAGESGTLPPWAQDVQSMRMGSASAPAASSPLGSMLQSAIRRSTPTDAFSVSGAPTGVTGAPTGAYPDRAGAPTSRGGLMAGDASGIVGVRTPTRWDPETGKVMGAPAPAAPKFAGDPRAGTSTGPGGPVDVATSSGSSSQQQRTTGSSTTNSRNFGTSAFNNTGSFSNSPFITPEYKSLADLMKGTVSRRLSTGGLPEGYREGGLIDINRAFRGANATIANRMAGAGISRSPVGAGITASTELARGGSISDFLRSLPLISRQLQDQDLDRAASLVSGFGRGESGTNRQAGTGTTSQYGQTQTNSLQDMYGSSIFDQTSSTPYHPPIVQKPPSAWQTGANQAAIGGVVSAGIMGAVLL